MRSEEHHQGDMVVYEFPRSPRGGWSHRGTGRCWKVEKLTTCRIWSIESLVFDRSFCPEHQRCSFSSQCRSARYHRLVSCFCFGRLLMFLFQFQGFQSVIFSLYLPFYPFISLQLLVFKFGLFSNLIFYCISLFIGLL